MRAVIYARYSSDNQREDPYSVFPLRYPYPAETLLMNCSIGGVERMTICLREPY